MSDYAIAFGKHVRSLRRARSLTQGVLATRSQVSQDTVRRIEHGAFSASIETIRKVCEGLEITPSTLFESFELGRHDDHREIVDLLSTRTPAERRRALRILRALFAEDDQ